MPYTIEDARRDLQEYGQEHVLRFWDELAEHERRELLDHVESVDFPLTERLIEQWILNTPKEERFKKIEPVPVIPAGEDPRARAAGEDALRAGKVGLVLVAGGQGTRLGFSGPKGAYPVGPVTGKSLFEYHAEKIHNLQRRFNCTLPWYIMVGDTNEIETIEFFEKHNYFGLKERDVIFFRQRMMPCISDDGKFFLETKHALARNPNGHGGVIPALVENGIAQDAKSRGIDFFSYFQVDNWAVRVADPVFLGYHILQGSQMSSKVARKTEPREAVGVFCECDGVYQVIEYTELDIYPQLLETDRQGNLTHYAGNVAIHIIDLEFVEAVYERFDEFPWHCSHKKIPYVDDRARQSSRQCPMGGSLRPSCLTHCGTRRRFL